MQQHPAGDRMRRQIELELSSESKRPAVERLGGVQICDRQPDVIEQVYAPPV